MARSASRLCWLWLLMLLPGLVAGLGARADEAPPSSRCYQFPDDTLAYPNELAWRYEIDPATGQMVGHRRDPKPEYVLHCFVVTRTSLQFFRHARFDPSEPKPTHACCQHLIHLVLARSPRRQSSEDERIVIPGYANLWEFSREQETLLKAESGGAWQSYLQRGNWRMVFPFSQRHQTRTSQQLIRILDQGSPVVVHLVCFPAQTINHALLLYTYQLNRDGIEFAAYDSNRPGVLTSLRFNRDRQRFEFPPNEYFAGGRLKVYRIYDGLFY